MKRRSAYQQTSGKPFLSAWSSITAMKRGGMEVFKAEIEARRVLDSALKEQTQDREHEKTKVKGRGRTD